RSWGQGAQHSQALHSFFMHTPGLKVVAPATPYDAKGCLIQSIRDNNPVMFIEHRMLFSQKSVVPQNLYTVDFGKARILSIGQDITIVGVSYMAVECLRAQKFLQEATVAAEVIDPVSLVPLDIDTILKSVKKSGKLLVVDTGWTSCGASAEIIARVCEKLGSLKDIQVQRIGFAPTPCPTTKNLENLFYPNAQKIAIAAYKMVGKKGGLKFQKDFEAPEIIQFKGPF
ncbi:MAG: alpha-ketoacid dehydrogenase subunit beta, partial [Methylovulum sp.]